MNYKTAHIKDYWVFISEDGTENYFGNENLSESDALMMLKARETGETQTAYEGEDMVVYAPNEAPKRVSKGEITIEEIYDMITDYK